LGKTKLYDQSKIHTMFERLDWELSFAVNFKPWQW
jgi:hypothetical protein